MSYFFTCFLSYLPTYMWSIRLRWRKLAACAQFKIQNSLPVLPVAPVPQFTIHNLPIPFALFRALYRLKKLFSLWCIKEISRAILLYFTNCCYNFNNASDTLPRIKEISSLLIPSPLRFRKTF